MLWNSTAPLRCHSPCSNCVEERNRRVDLNRTNNEQRDTSIPDILCQISSAEREYSIWNQDPNNPSLNYGCKNIDANLECRQFQAHRYNKSNC
jgi:hypothetical protein